MKTFAYQNLTQSHETDFRDLSKLKVKASDKKTNTNFRKRHTWKIATAKRPDLNEPILLLKTQNLI
jgi:hypothetical protein